MGGAAITQDWRLKAPAFTCARSGTGGNKHNSQGRTSVVIVLILYTLAIAIGVYMGLRHARGRRVFSAVGYTHGLCGIAATVGLGFVIRGQPTEMLINDALFLFGLVIAAGLFMVLMRRKGIAPPMLYWAFHGVVAVCAFALLINGL